MLLSWLIQKSNKRTIQTSKKGDVYYSFLCEIREQLSVQIY